MTRYSDTTRCPDCGQQLPAAPVSCPSCRLPLTGPLAQELADTLRLADGVLARLRASATAPASRRVDDHLPAGPERVGVLSPPQRGRGLEAASVPRILLGLGALCLLVASVTFLAVAWASLGIGGRTTVLVALTVLAGLASTWLARRGLRVAAESMSVVALGLLCLDVVGAADAGWLGELSTPGVLLVTGAATAAASLVASLAARTTEPLATPQLAAVVGTTLAGAGALGLVSSSDATALVTLVAVLAHLTLVALGRTTGLRLLPAPALAAAGLWWLSLALDGLARAADHATVRALWLEQHAWPLVAATVLLLAPVVLRRAHPRVARAGAAAAAVLGSVTVALPALDEPVLPASLTVLAALVTWSLALVAAPRSWAVVAAAPLLVALLPGLAVTSALVNGAASAALTVGDPLTAGPGVRVPAVDPVAHPLLLVPMTAALLLAGSALTRWSRPHVALRTHAVVLLAVVAGSGVATAALYAAPLAVVAGGLAAVGAALVVPAVRRRDLSGTAYAATGLLVALAATVVALPSAMLTAGVLTVVVAGGAAVAVRGRFPHALGSAEALLPLATAALLWTALKVAEVDPALRAAPVLLLVLGAALARPRPAVEGSAWAAAALAAAAAVPVADDVTVSLALHLTLAGALLTGSALVHPHRGSLGWAGGLLLAAATWVRLADLGVAAPEAYTLPSAVALVLVGLRHLARDAEASTRVALGPGLALATVPSLLAVLAGDPVSARALLLGAGSLVLVLVGARLRWSAPVATGSVVGGLLVLRELAPYAAQTPQWVLIGLAGTVLTLVGVTWESRLTDLHRSAEYLGRLR